MATIRQIQANRRNSQKSTGPRSASGKAVSSINALKSGIDAKSHIIRGEDSEALNALKERYYESLQPTRPEEAVLVDAMIAADWLLRRLRKAEAEIWNEEFQSQDDRAERYDEDPEEFRLAAAFTGSQTVFSRLQRRMDAAERSLHRALHELRRLRASRNVPDDPTPVDPPPPVLLTPSFSDPKPQIGFVPSTSHSPCNAAQPSNPSRATPWNNEQFSS